MAKPIEHDAFDTVEEALIGGIKTPLKYLVGMPAVIGGAIGAFASMGGAITAMSAGGAGFAAAATGLATGAGIGAALGVGSVLAVGGIAALAGASVITPVVALLGVLGLAKGVSKAGKENAAYAAKVREAQNQPQVAAAHARNAGLQEGFQAGVEQGRAAGVEQGRAEVLGQLQQAQAQMEEASPSHAERHAAKKSGSHSAMIEAQKEAKAAAGTQLGV